MPMFAKHRIGKNQTQPNKDNNRKPPPEQKCFGGGFCVQFSNMSKCKGGICPCVFIIAQYADAVKEKAKTIHRDKTKYRMPVHNAGADHFEISEGLKAHSAH